MESIFHIIVKWREKNSEKNVFSQTGKLFLTDLITNTYVKKKKKSGAINDSAKCLPSNCEKGQKKYLLSGSSSVTFSTFRIFSLLLIFLVVVFNKATAYLSNVD